MTKLVLLLLIVPTLAYADDRKVPSADGSCSIAVPSAWKGDKSLATSPDKKVSAVVSHPKAMDNFDDAKSTIKMMYKGKVTKDTASELEIEGPSALNKKPSVYRAVASGKTICIVEVDYESGTVDDARKVARTLAVK